MSLHHPVESLSAFLDGELEDAKRRSVAEHLAACPSCARHLRELAAVDALARGIPPAAAPDGYLETLPGRVRQRIRADRSASRRAPWVWPLAAGLALAVLAPIVLRDHPASAPFSPGRPDVVMEAPAASPPSTIAPEQPPQAAAPGGSAATLQDERRRIDSVVAADEGAGTLPPAASRARREVAPEPKARTFAAAPPAPAANEGDRAAKSMRDGGMVGATPAAAPYGEQEALAAGRRKEEPTESTDAQAERSDAPASLKKADSPRRSAATPQAERRQVDSGVAPPRSAATPQDEQRRIHSGAAEVEKAFHDSASLPASTPEEARRAREAWRRFVSRHTAGPRADEGRVRFIEAAVAVFRLTRDEGDRAIAERKGGAYLAVSGAPQESRVRAALRRLDDPH